MHRFPHTKGLEMLANTAVYTAARAQTTVSETSQTERSYLRGGNEDQASVRPFIYKTLDVGKQQSYEPFFSLWKKKKIRNVKLSGRRKAYNEDLYNVRVRFCFPQREVGVHGRDGFHSGVK